MFANPQEVSEYAKDCLDIIETKSFYVESVDKEIDYVYQLYNLALQNDIRAVALFKSKALDLINNKNNSITKQQQEIYDLMLNSNHRIEKLTDKINQAKDYLFNYVNDERLANRIETLEDVLSLMKMKHSELEEENEKLIGQIDRIVELEDKYLKLFNEKFSDVSIGTAIKEVQEKTSETKISFNIGLVFLGISIVLWIVGFYLSIRMTPVDVSVLNTPTISNTTNDGTINVEMFQPIINSLKYVTMLFGISLMIMVVNDIKNAAEGKGEIITIMPKIVVGLIISLISASFTFPTQNENQYSDLINNFKTEPTKVNLDALNQEMKLSDKTYNYLLAATNKEDAAKYVVSFRKDMSVLPNDYSVSYIRYLEKQYDDKLIATYKNFSLLKVAALILAIVSGVMMIIAHKEKKYFSEFN
jgi:hypothetical protein